MAILVDLRDRARTMLAALLLAASGVLSSGCGSTATAELLQEASDKDLYWKLVEVSKYGECTVEEHHDCVRLLSLRDGYWRAKGVRLTYLVEGEEHWLSWLDVRDPLGAPPGRFPSGYSPAKVSFRIPISELLQEVLLEDVNRALHESDSRKASLNVDYSFHETKSIRGVASTEAMSGVTMTLSVAR